MANPAIRAAVAEATPPTPAESDRSRGPRGTFDVELTSAIAERSFARNTPESLAPHFVLRLWEPIMTHGNNTQPRTKRLNAHLPPPTLRSTLRPPPGRIKGATRHSVMASGHP